MNATTTSPTLVFKRLLVPTDFSEASRQALPLAVSLARQFQAGMILVHVVPAALPAELSYIGLVLEEKRLVEEAGKRLAEFREKELPAGLAVETRVLSGSPAFEITHLAAALSVDLIVTATHGHTGLAHLWLGSTAERIIAHAPCPVLVARAAAVPIRFPDAPVCRFQRILVPLDFSSASTSALRSATALARLGDGSVTLLHVIEPPPYPESGYAHVPAKEAEMKRAAQDKLQALRQDPSMSELPASLEFRFGAAHHQIVEQAAAENADLIVMATRGHSALAHLLLGSTTERVVRHARCPVLVVRPVAPASRL